ncbi:hypothetical protein F4781DRAFT_290434 [Annulohypoxylon bovei var. microspora]|nr:hypothetical protein F4781DRAFT_290434 [Annulohypoxylon bovei var. microspora]
MTHEGPYDGLSEAIKYDFLTELSPGVWKICRQEDRIEYLAHDITDDLAEDPSNLVDRKPTKLLRLLVSEKTSIMAPLLEILKHDNLVSLVDIFTLQRSNAGGKPTGRQYAVWDFCDAGNLGNLLVLEQRAWKQSNPIDDEEWDESDDGPNEELDDWIFNGIMMKDDLKRMKDDNSFLPESLCWHVLTSVLRAIAWLHDGTLQYKSDTSTGVKFVPNVDWSPILHRNITPENIFLMHPKRNEWYGTCKLGNYGSVFVSGHHNAHPQTPAQRRARSKALVPTIDQEFEPLSELIQLDEEFDYTYPQQPNQPYTKINELRAVGEILQAMMVPPISEYGHVDMMREQSVQENIASLNYSHTLKNMAVWLMDLNPDQKDEEGKYMWSERGRQYLATLACTQGQRAYQEWLSSDHPEAGKMVSLQSEVYKQALEDDAETAQEYYASKAVDDLLQKQDDLFEVFYATPQKGES